MHFLLDVIATSGKNEVILMFTMANNHNPPYYNNYYRLSMSMTSICGFAAPRIIIMQANIRIIIYYIDVV